METREKYRNTTENFIKSALLVHGDEYDYSETVYQTSRLPVNIRCSKHGVFTQKASNHLQGSGCSQCARETTKNQKTFDFNDTNDFIKRARLCHGNTYQYGNTVYTGSKNSVIITCRIHGDFEQLSWTHIGKHKTGCPKCGRDKAKKHTTLSVTKFIENAVKVHGARYDYTKVVLHGERASDESVEIVCRDHGVFVQKVRDHLYRKRGCVKCLGKIVDRDGFLSKAKALHGTLYDYHDVVYNGTHTDITIVCCKHGEYQQTPAVHIRPSKGAGCPRCHEENFGSSMVEKSLRLWVEEQGVVVRPNAVGVIPKYEIDIWLEDFKVGIEFHGLYWHSERFKEPSYHQDKWAVSSDIKLIQVFCDEWQYKRDLVKSMILAKIGKSPNRIFARKCEVLLVSYDEGTQFFEDNHLQGRDSSKRYYALKFNGMTVSCLSLTYTDGVAKIQRFANIAFHSVPGGFSRLLKAFIRDHDVHTIETYANLRYSNGEVYKKCGFEMIKVTDPGYFYFRPGTHPKRESRQKYQAHKLRNAGLVGTERSMTRSMNLLRVYDAGHMLLRLSI